jgi:hypothetical protein
MTGKQGKMRVKSVTAKVTEAEEKRLIEAAEAHGLRLAEWSRMTLLREANFPPVERILLEEIESVRLLLLNTFGHIKGVQKESAESFQRSTNAALDRQKRTLADQRILEAQRQQTAAKESAA